MASGFTEIESPNREWNYSPFKRINEKLQKSRLVTTFSRVHAHVFSMQLTDVAATASELHPRETA